MTPPALLDFPNYFRELHDCDPYDWQLRMAERAIAGNWPDFVDLPTGSGKTACLDVAVFALACQASLDKREKTAPRRIFFAVNRRVIVDEAHQRAWKIARKLAEAESTSTTLGRVAQALRSLSTLRPESAPPLDVLELRGGIYRDNRWARSATQPTIVCTTIDQLGSRLLFRGYGVSPNAAPVQAALIAYDSLVFLDEAHISRPFLQTLKFVKDYLDPDRWARKRVGPRPMLVVPMTATPPDGVDAAKAIRLGPEDRGNPSLAKRLEVDKWVELSIVDDKNFERAVETRVNSFVKDVPAAVGVVVNRVAAARNIYNRLRAARPGDRVELVIGSMRPFDRDRQAARLRPLVGPDRPSQTTRTTIVVSTQCLEVGADYDFDVLIAECASLDALRQRFGRLNRRGRNIQARGAIIVTKGAVKDEDKLNDDKPLDPIYGNALTRTWHWLNRHAAPVPLEPDTPPDETKDRSPKSEKVAPSAEPRINFGIDAFDELIREHGVDGGIPEELLAPSARKNAPVMFPSYVDIWCQTSPRPVPEPEVALFIHGVQPGEPDVQVCWREDLRRDNRNQWCDIVGLLSPTAAECMSVPISRVRRWLTGEPAQSDSSDLLGTDAPPPTKPKSAGNGKVDQLSAASSKTGVLWRGAGEGKSKIIESPDELRPGDTLVLPADAEDREALGHIPDGDSSPVDIAEEAFRAARNRAILRLHPSRKSRLPESDAVAALFDRIQTEEEPLRIPELRDLLRAAADDLDAASPEIASTFRELADPALGLMRETYPDERGVVLFTRRRLIAKPDSHTLPVLDEGEDDRSRTTREEPILLEEHSRRVRDEVMRTVRALPLLEDSDTYRVAADLHDLGKADERFQAMLRRTDRTDAWLLAGANSEILAKSDGMPQTPKMRKLARERAELPEGFRHEMLSAQIAALSGRLPDDPDRRELILHLVASHHGFARPFAPVVPDEQPPDVEIDGVTLSSNARSEIPPHRIDSGIPDRFWNLARQHGWWGLAFLEAVLRLADQQASADEDGEQTRLIANPYPKISETEP